MLLPPFPIIYRRRAGAARAKKPVPAPPAALTLVAAEYNHDVDRVVILTFDRAIDIAGLDGSDIIVDDGNDLGLKFRGNGGASLDDPVTVRVLLTEDGDATAPDTVLTAVGGAGIIAAGDGAPWAGVNNLSLPFP